MSKTRKSAPAASSRGRRIAKSDPVEPVVQPASLEHVSLFLIVFDAADVHEPRVELEYGAHGPVDPAYLPELAGWLREAWYEQEGSSELTEGCVAIQGYARNPDRGFPDTDVGKLSADIGTALRELIAGGPAHAALIRGSEQECELSVWFTMPDLVDKYVKRWQVEAADSSSGMWNQALVSSSRHQSEESAMQATSRRRRMPTTSETAKPDLASVLSTIEQLNQSLTDAQQPLQQEFQTLLDQLAGSSFGSVDANTAVADAIRFLMLRLEVRVECPREGCNEPALIRCRPAGRTRHGSFEFEHRRNGRLSTHAASTRLPNLKLVPAPPHARRKVPS